jgi:hypothetical protein
MLSIFIAFLFKPQTRRPEPILRAPDETHLLLATHARIFALSPPLLN